MWKLIGGVFLGWGLGSNDAANIFGTGVAARVLTYRTAIILISIFVVVGSLSEGYKSMDIVGEMATMSNTAAFIAALTDRLGHRAPDLAVVLDDPGGKGRIAIDH